MTTRSRTKPRKNLLAVNIRAVGRLRPCLSLGPGSRLVVDVLAYMLARLLLVAVLAAVIFGRCPSARTARVPGRHRAAVRDRDGVAAGNLDVRPAAQARDRQHRRVRRAAPPGPRAAAGPAARRRAAQEVTHAVSREAFGAEFVGAEGFLNSPTYGLPPQFLFDALQDCLRTWQAGTMDVPSFDESVSAGRAGYAALVGVPVDSVTMAGTVSSAARTGRRRHSRRQPGGDSARRIHQHHVFRSPPRRRGASPSPS